MNNKKTANNNIRRQFNFFRVLRSIWLEDGVSRIELCQKLNLDKATMSTIVSLLIKLEIVEEIKPNNKEIKPGRRPIGLGVIKDFGYVLGFEYRVHGLKVVVKDMCFTTIKEFFFPRRIKVDEIKSAFFHAFSEVKKFLKEKPVIGVGVAIPGVVNHDTGTILHSWELGIVDTPYDFKTEILDILDISGFIDNDANCCAWGVLTKHRTKEYSNFLYTLFSFEPMHKDYNEDDHLSLGLGIVNDGKIYCGPDSTAGEFQTIAFRKNRINQFDMSVEDQSLYGTSPEIQEKVYEDLTSHLALLINFFNFKQIFLGGDLPNLVPELKKKLQKAIDRNWPYGENRSCKIYVKSEKEHITSSGAAGMFLEQLFTVPELDHDRGAIIWQKVFRRQDFFNL